MNRKKNGKLTGRQVLYWFVGFFAVVIVTDIVLVRLAVRSFPGEEVEKSYYQGLNYNDVLEEKARQEDLGWRMQLVTVPGARTEPLIEVRLVSQDGSPVYDATVDGEIVRPMTESGRQALSFIPLGEGIYRARAIGIEPGAWKLSLAAVSDTSGETMLSAETRIVVE